MLSYFKIVSGFTFLIQYSIHLPGEILRQLKFTDTSNILLIFELRLFTIIENQCVNFINVFVLNFM